MARKFDINWHTSHDPQLYAYRLYVYYIAIDVPCHERFQCNQNYWKNLTNNYEKLIYSKAVTVFRPLWISERSFEAIRSGRNHPCFWYVCKPHWSQLFESLIQRRHHTFRLCIIVSGFALPKLQPPRNEHHWYNQPRSNQGQDSNRRADKQERHKIQPSFCSIQPATKFPLKMFPHFYIILHYSLPLLKSTISVQYQDVSCNNCTVSVWSVYKGSH